MGSTRGRPRTVPTPVHVEAVKRRHTREPKGAPGGQASTCSRARSRPRELVASIVPFKREVYQHVVAELGHFAQPLT